MSQRFIRCAHCGLPHGLDEPLCPITGRPLEARRARALGGTPSRPGERSPALQSSPSRPGMRSPALQSPPTRPGPGDRLQPRPLDPPARAAPAAAARPHSSSPPPFEALATSPPPPLIGQVLGGKYRALRVLGEGGMGTVYECEHVALHRRVAVKVLHPAQAKKKASVVRFQNEAHVAGAIGHPNICEIYDMGELEDNSPFLVMELLQGETLADRIGSEGALPFDDIIDVISQVLSGLVAAHDKGIIHRDIKPENVFLTHRAGLPAMVKLLDFGISKMAGADELNLTRTGMVMGTPFYMSPEQARGDRNLDSRVDLYATGVMLYECLTGRRPFHAANYNALLMQILTTDPRPPQEIRPAVSEAFAAVVARAMVRDREKRYQSASEFQRDVQLLRDPGTMRRMPSVAPEPVPLVTQRRREDLMPSRPAAPLKPAAASRSNEPPKPIELAAVSISLEGRDLLDSGLDDGDSGSIEIPIVAEAPISSREARALYRPDPVLEAMARSKSLPPATPRPSAPVPPSSIPPASVPRPSKPSMPPPLPHASRPAAPKPSSPGFAAPKPIPAAKPLPAIPPRERVQAPPSMAKPPARYPAAVPDAPWLDDPDPDPTEIGSIFGIPRAVSDTPIDADSTERIPPERLQRLQQQLPRGASGTDPRAEPAVHSPSERLSTDRFDVHHERGSDDEAPTTLFDRSALKAKLAKKSKSGQNPPLRPSNATERAPAPERPAPAAAPLKPPPLPRLRGPRDS